MGANGEPQEQQPQEEAGQLVTVLSFTDPAISMDLLRAVLQPSINEEIQTVFNKYMKFFQKAAFNVKENVGEDVDPEQLIHEVCRNCLEQAKQLFTDAEKMGARPGCDLPGVKRTKQMDEESSQRGSPVPKKKKGRPPGPNMPPERVPYNPHISKPRSTEPVKREGPKWDPSRLTEATRFVLGSRANKALGMGGTRGRIYTKHPELFKYAADPQDKHWLAERQHMKATGGKMAYLLIEDDIQDLAVSEDYRESPDLRLDELKPFVVPHWMVEKMQQYMEVVRTERD
ncbi:deoxynucleotidyltransferase terminal-interacting protein 1 [Protopterus annectens]|uniref:deoxynucleotidyltransferase terminal-interacting protein 1 n=1 Tax=Protopterus annectens TaxID=7888 RepID=UPI001CFB051D|nr:deoxynucleotidyltransferase terminal-interacting protein 1 [Protopterus annectens]